MLRVIFVFAALVTLASARAGSLDEIISKFDESAGARLSPRYSDDIMRDARLNVVSDLLLLLPQTSIFG